MQRESDYAVPKGGECQREPALIAFRLAAAHGRLGLTWSHLTYLSAQINVQKRLEEPSRSRSGFEEV